MKLDQALEDRLRELGATDGMLTVLERQLETQRLLRLARTWAEERREHLAASFERLRLEPHPPGRNVILCATPFGNFSFEELLSR